MINYILQVVLFQALFLAVYDFFLQKETFFKWNRFYLLITPLLSFVIPMMKFESFQRTVPQQYIEQLPTVLLNPQVFIEQTNQHNSTLNFMAIAFYVGLVLFALLFLIRLTRIFKLIASNTIIKKQNYFLVLLEKKQSAFSFFKYIFINEHLLKSKDLQIINHELIHCKQKHTLDLLFFEILKIVFWFNPLVYVYQKRITLLHEYISDAEVVKETDKKVYFNRLLSETFSVENISFINQFFKHSLIKKRIVMITKEKSQKIKQLKYLLIVPLLVGMLFYASCMEQANEELYEMENVLNQYDESEGKKYFDFEVGKTFVGSSLMISRYLDLEEYTPKEKQLHEQFNNMEGSKYDYVVLIDVNDERVNWFRPISVRLGNNKKKREYVKGEDVPFAIIEDVPIFPGCEGTKEELRVCLQEKITKHVNRNFNSSLATDLNLSPGIKRIFVMFKIDKEGKISNVKARAPHQKLADEAIRVVNLLPQMIPGKQKGDAVGVKYSLPIAFKVEGAVTSKEYFTAIKEVLIGGDYKTIKKGDEVPFAIIDEVPVYPGCKGTKLQLRTCLQEKITAHVNENFNSTMAKGLGLTSGIKRIFVMFKIDKEGNITDVKARAPHKVLQEEALRVINLLPQMIPGKQKGDAVGVKYSLPIAFKVE